MTDTMENTRALAVAHKPAPVLICPVCGAVQVPELCPLGLCFLCAGRCYVETVEDGKGES
jgi:hypothetical protein